MRLQISSIQNSPVITCNDGVGSDNADKIPVRSVFNSTQSPHAPGVGCHDSANWRESGSALRSVFSGARVCPFREALTPENACLEAPYMTPAEVPGEMCNGDLLDTGMSINAGNTSLLPPFDSIWGKHYGEWGNYNRQCDVESALGNSLPSEMTFFEASYITPAKVAVEMPAGNPALLDMDANVGNASLLPHFDLIEAKHFEEWGNYNTECDSHLAPGQSAPPEMDAHMLLEMINGDHDAIAYENKAGVATRAREFAAKYNISPLVWSVMVVFNGKPATFLPCWEHRVMAKTTKPDLYHPITALDVNEWQRYVKNRIGRVKRVSFANSRKINPETFRKIVSAKGALTLDRVNRRIGMKFEPETFIKPELLGVSNASSERITAEHLKGWEQARTVKDYGIVFYMYQTAKWPRGIEEKVKSLRRCQEKGAVLTAPDFVCECRGELGISQKVITDIINWDQLSALTRRSYAIRQFASYCRLDELGWRFFAWSNELAMLSSLVSQREDGMWGIQEIQEIRNTLSRLKDALKIKIQQTIEPG